MASSTHHRAGLPSAASGRLRGQDCRVVRIRVGGVSVRAVGSRPSSLPQDLELTGLPVRRPRAHTPTDVKSAVVVEGRVDQKLSAAGRHHRWQKIVAIASCREDADQAIHPSIECFEHFDVDIFERLRLDHSTKKNDVSGGELRRWQDTTANTVAGICGARKSEQSEGAEKEHRQLSLVHVPLFFSSKRLVPDQCLISIGSATALT